jgi:1-phosphofructokinase
MILTVTPTPAIDLTLELDELVLGALNRSDLSEKEASGKGVNVSWALHRAGVDTLALFPAGGSGAVFMAQTLTDANLPHRIVPISEDVRTNITVRPHRGIETKINSPGNRLADHEQTAFLNAVDQELEQATYMCLSGSAPTDAPDGFMSDLVTLAKKHGVPTIVDTSGPALTDAISAHPDVITPNVHELHQITGATFNTLGDVEEAAQNVRRSGVDTVIVTLGASGALLVDGEGTLWARGKGVRPLNSVGAGDALTAGYLSTNESRDTMLATAVWWASSAVESLTTLFSLNPALREGVSVRSDFKRSATLV